MTKIILLAAAVMALGTASARADDLDATITAYLEQPGALGDALRQFHACVVRATLDGHVTRQGVLGVYSPMGDCSKTGVALVTQCMKIQHNGSACGAVIATSSAHAIQHAPDFKFLESVAK